MNSEKRFESRYLGYCAGQIEVASSELVSEILVRSRRGMNGAERNVCSDNGVQGDHEPGEPDQFNEG